jgi:hypothetical protein
VLLPLYAHFSRPFWTGQPLAYPTVQKSGAAAERPFRSEQKTGNKPNNQLTEKPPYKSANRRSLGGELPTQTPPAGEFSPMPSDANRGGFPRNSHPVGQIQSIRLAR